MMICLLLALTAPLEQFSVETVVYQEVFSYQRKLVLLSIVSLFHLKLLWKGGRIAVLCILLPSRLSCRKKEILPAGAFRSNRPLPIWLKISNTQIRNWVKKKPIQQISQLSQVSRSNGLKLALRCFFFNMYYKATTTLHWCFRIKSKTQS